MWCVQQKENQDSYLCYWVVDFKFSVYLWLSVSKDTFNNFKLVKDQWTFIGLPVDAGIGVCEDETHNKYKYYSTILFISLF